MSKFKIQGEPRPPCPPSDPHYSAYKTDIQARSTYCIAYLAISATYDDCCQRDYIENPFDISRISKKMCSDYFIAS